MNSTIKTIICTLAFLAVCTNINAQKNINRKMKIMEFPLTEKHWAPITDNVEFVTYKSVPVARSTNDNGFGIMLQDFEFTNGTIEFDVELKGMGFPGIDFRVDKDTLNSEKFYIRYFGTPDDLRRTTLQYAAVLDRVNLWDLTDEYQAAAPIYEGKWNHVKLVINGKQMKVYVNNEERPALHIPALEGITDSGAIALSGNVIYANFVVRPSVTEGLAADEGYDHTYSDSRYLRNWSVTDPIDFPFETAMMRGIPRSPGVAIASDLFDSTAVWKPLRAGRRGLVNLTREFGGVEQGKRKLTWLKTTITSESEQEKRVDFGFSDEVWVFINGQPLMTDKNYYGSPGMKEPRGRCTIENTSFRLPLQKGENEILIGVSNYFFGWGIVARLSDTQGLKFVP